jgi:hypothetical protein
VAQQEIDTMAHTDHRHNISIKKGVKYPRHTGKIVFKKRQKVFMTKIHMEL